MARRRNSMRKQFIVLLMLLALLPVFSGCGSQTEPVDAAPEQTEQDPVPEEQPVTATLAVCGDVMTHMPVTEDAWDDSQGDYDYTPIMAAAEPYVAGADYAVANLETTMSGGPNYSGYPTFNAPDALARNLKDLGFDLVLTANNHCMDKGFTGLSRTLDVLDQNGLAHVGTSRTEEEAENNLHVADVGGIKVAFLGYTYGTNGIPVQEENAFSVNLFNTDYLTNLSTLDETRLASDLDQAKELDPDLIVVMIHWGIEYQTKENSYQDEVAQFLFDHGADVILGGHPHVLEPMELRTLTEEDGTTHQGFVCYSLGNFISSQTKTNTDVTVVLTLQLTRDPTTGVTNVTGYSYVPMMMLHRPEGYDQRLELLDVYHALSQGGYTETTTEHLQESIETCHAILGADCDAGAA